MKIAVVVLNYNDFDNTSKYIKNIENYEIINKIIIVDNKSTNKDEIKKLKALESKKVDLIISDKNGGYAYGNNFGLKYIDNVVEKEEKIDYVIISNPDVFISEENIKKTVEYLKQNKNVAIASPRMNFVTGPSRRSAWKKRTFLIDVASCTRITQLLMYFLFKKGEYLNKDLKKDTLKVFAIAGSFFVSNHKIIKSIGYFDEGTFLFYEEDILGEKIKNAGYDIVSLNDIDFMHFESQCIGKMMNIFKKQDILFESRIYYHKKYNNINKIQVIILKILKYIRKLELIFEIPILKIIYRRKKI